MVLLLLLVIPGTCSAQALMWGALAGVLGIIAVTMLYKALGDGVMAVVAPVAAVTAAAVPAAGGLMLGERPTPLALCGVGLALVAITLLTGGGSGVKVVPRNVLLAVGAGAASGLFFLLLGQTDESAGMWPLASEAVVSIAIGLAILLPSRNRAGGRTVLVLACLAGLLDTLASGLYLLATQHGQLTLVAPIASLDPVSTVLLALLINGERLRRVQWGGLALAMTALLLASLS